jgi:hypothetical protein
MSFDRNRKGYKLTRRGVLVASILEILLMLGTVWVLAWGVWGVLNVLAGS